ncbi:glycosyltransferase [Candidatus Accumulibacter aalborgensis]|nr:glycosyltransferase [Candidatus Accumulibacter aalborgensis]
MNANGIQVSSLNLRKPRLLWASVYCLLDTSSGASIAVREMLRQLAHRGYDVSILGATVFDHDRGTAGLQGAWADVQASRGGLVSLKDGALEHKLFATTSTRREQMTSFEEWAWFSLYQQALATCKPDVVFYYGGQPFDLLIACEARAREIPAVFYLANGNYTQARWCRDVDLVLTDSQATADMYTRRLGVAPRPVGAFIDPARVLASEHTRERILFINPILAKGVAVVIRLAMLLEKRRPDIVFEVVESRGKWSDILRSVSAAMGQPREMLTNVVATPNTNDMRPVYGRARLLVAPSLWWESSGRVLAEAMLNGIPAICTDRGGMPEMVQDGGIILKLGAGYYEEPYTGVPPDEALEPLLQRIEVLYDDEAQYAELAARALRVGRTRHPLNLSTQRLLQALQPLVDRQAGDKDAGAAVRQWHRHGLDDRWALGISDRAQ